MQRLRDLILSVFILGSIVVIILLIITFFNTKRTVIINENPSTEKKLNTLKTEASSLNDSTCKNFIDYYINAIDEGYFVGKTKTRDLAKYINKYATFTIFPMAREKCNIDDDLVAIYGFSGKFMTLMVLNENLINPYSYEMRILDTNRSINRDAIPNMSYNGYRSIQVELLEDFINIAKNMEESYE